MIRDLPSQWQAIPIDDVTVNLDSKRVPLNREQRAEKEEDGLYPYVGANNILSYINEYIYDEKILCVAEDGGSWGYNQQCSFIMNEKCWVNNHAHVLTAKNNLVLEYLKFYLNYADLTMHINGATRGKLNKSVLNKIRIPLPPLPEQQKIAAILDAADQLRQKDQQLIEHYTRLSQSLFLEMFGDPVSNPMGWDVKPFDYFAIIDTVMTSDFEQYANVPHIGVANIVKNTGELVNYNLVRDEKLSSGKYIFTKDHIIYSKIRPILNKVALPSFSGLTSADSYPILVNTDNSNKIFFAFILRSKLFLDFISKHSSRTNIPKANKAQLKQFRSIVPPIKLQNQFAQHIEKIEQQKQQAQTSLEKSEALFNSLLQRAFKGELTG